MIPRLSIYKGHNIFCTVYTTHRLNTVLTLIQLTSLKETIWLSWMQIYLLLVIKDGCIDVELRMPCQKKILKPICFMASTDLTDSNDLAIMDASTIGNGFGHHGK